MSNGRTARALRTLLAATRSADAVAALTPAEAARLSGTLESDVAPLFTEPPGLAAAKRRLQDVKGRIIGLLDGEYPPLLREIPDAPPILFARGKPMTGGPAIAVVGARRASRAGLEAARRITYDLARAGVTIVSGFARGIDAAAHEAALEAEGTTIAVFGCGIDVCYPPEQEPLLEKLLARGTAITEFGPGTQPLPPHFPVRNRIIAGIARIVLVVEGAEKSGSLITARCASDYGRDVAAVPGSVVTPSASGSNALLKDGAILVRTAEDLLAELPDEDRAALRIAPPAAPDAAPPVIRDPDAAAVFEALDPDEPKGPDALLLATKLTPARLSAALVRLELDGLASALPGAVFLRVRTAISSRT